jgi:hypothetical protein
MRFPTDFFCFSFHFLFFLLFFTVSRTAALVGYDRAASFKVPFSQVNVKVKIASAPSYAVNVEMVPSAAQVNASFVIFRPGGGAAMLINALWMARYASSYLP